MTFPSLRESFFFQPFLGTFGEQLDLPIDIAAIAAFEAGDFGLLFVELVVDAVQVEPVGLDAFEQIGVLLVVEV